MMGSRSKNYYQYRHRVIERDPALLDHPNFEYARNLVVSKMTTAQFESETALVQPKKEEDSSS